MKPNFIATVAMVLALGSLAQGKPIILKRYLPENGKIENVEVVRFNNVYISKSCIKKGLPSCLAWDALRAGNNVKTKASIPLVGHPASRMCQAKLGTSLIFIDESGVEVDYCLFKDNSAVKSWDLYNAIKDKN